MERASLPDARPRAAGIALSGLALALGWAASMPFADALLPRGGFPWLLRLCALSGGLLALLGFVARQRDLVWSGVVVAALLFLAARDGWLFVPLPVALGAAAAWWQVRQPRGRVPA